MIYYHYTSLNAFYNIIKTKSFWLTSLRSSNDTLELFYTISQFKSDIECLIANEKDPVFRKWLTGISISIDLNKQEFNNYCALPKKRDVFGLSLSSKRDNLTHWDRYADRCTGISIGVDDTFIMNLLREKKMDYFGGSLISLSDVIYEDDIQIEMREMFDKLYQGGDDKEIMEVIYSNHPYVFAINVYTSIARFAKSQSFIDEHETRIFHDNADIKETQLVIKDTLKSHKNIFNFVNKKYQELLDSTHLREIQHYCSPNRGVRAYKELCLADIWNESTIPEVIIGPMSPQSKDELLSFLKASGLNKTKVYKSKVSIR